MDCGRHNGLNHILVEYIWPLVKHSWLKWSHDKYNMLEMVRAANSPVFGLSAKDFETVR